VTTAAEADLAAAAGRWHRAKSREREAMAMLHRAVREASEAGLSEARLAELAGVTRNTVRRALGRKRH
jgi:DNA-binding transcriptional regulator YhcF (GntR family)